MWLTYCSGQKGYEVSSPFLEHLKIEPMPAKEQELVSVSAPKTLLWIDAGAKRHYKGYVQLLPDPLVVILNCCEAIVAGVVGHDSSVDVVVHL